MSRPAPLEALTESEHKTLMQRLATMSITRIYRACGVSEHVLRAACKEKPMSAQSVTKIRAWLAISLLSACALISHGCHGLHIDWPKVVQCAGPVSQALVTNVLAILTRDGTATDLSTTAVSDLEALAGKYGASTIVCIIEALIDGWMSGNPQASPANAAAAGRGQQFLNDREVTVLAPQ